MQKYVCPSACLLCFTAYTSELSANKFSYTDNFDLEDIDEKLKL